MKKLNLNGLTIAGIIYFIITIIFYIVFMVVELPDTATDLMATIAIILFVIFGLLFDVNFILSLCSIFKNGIKNPIKLALLSQIFASILGIIYFVFGIVSILMSLGLMAFPLVGFIFLTVSIFVGILYIAASFSCVLLPACTVVAHVIYKIKNKEWKISLKIIVGLILQFFAFANIIGSAILKTVDDCVVVNQQ